MHLGLMPNTGIYCNAVLHKVTSKLKYFYRKNRFLSKDLEKLLWKVLIQLHFDYVCVQMDSREHIGTEHFDKIKWLTIDQRFKQCLSTSIFRFSEMCPHMINIYKTSNQNNTVTRNSSLNLLQPLKD